VTCLTQEKLILYFNFKNISISTPFTHFYNDYGYRQGRCQWRSQPKNLGGAKKIGGVKMLDFRRITLFCLEKRFSTHKMTTFSENLGGHGLFGPPWLRLWPVLGGLGSPIYHILHLKHNAYIGPNKNVDLFQQMLIKACF